jgi:hypothetical protein
MDSDDEDDNVDVSEYNINIFPTILIVPLLISLMYKLRKYLKVRSQQKINLILQYLLSQMLLQHQLQQQHHLAKVLFIKHKQLLKN